MRNKKYKILFFDNRKGSIREFNFSKIFIFSSLAVLLISNFLFFNYFSNDFAKWKNNNLIVDHKKNNEFLVETIHNSEDRISNIEEKINYIIKHDDNIRELLKLPKINTANKIKANARPSFFNIGKKQRAQMLFTRSISCSCFL